MDLSNLELLASIERCVGRTVIRDAKNNAALTRLDRVVSDKRSEGLQIKLEVVMEFDVTSAGAAPPSSVVTRICPIYHSGPSRWNSHTLDDQNAVEVRCGGVLERSEGALLGKRDDGVTLDKE